MYDTRVAGTAPTVLRLPCDLTVPFTNDLVAIEKPVAAQMGKF